MELPRLPLQISERKTLLACVDLILVSGAVLTALRLWALRDPSRALSQRFALSPIHWLLFLTALWFVVAYLNDFYSLKIAANPLSSILILLRIAVFMLLTYLFIYFVAPRHLLPRLFILLYVVISSIFVGLWRTIYALFFSRSPFQRRAIIVGAGSAGRTIAQAIKENLGSDYHLVGYIDDDPLKQGQIIPIANNEKPTADSGHPESLPVLGTSRDLRRVVQTHGVSEIILAVTRNMRHELFRALMDCHEQGVQITPMPVLYEEITGRVPVEHIGDNWPVALPLEHASMGSLFSTFKRTVDIAIAAFGLVILAILFPFIALALYIDSPGPIFYTQERVGKGGKTFRLVKFRSMIPNAEAEGTPVWAQENDPRVTRVGWFLRKTRLDELPQFINVLRGEMSVVGPRPERPEFVAELEKQLPFYRMRHAVKPGMAGWAMLHQDYAGSVEDALVRLQYDLYYIKHQSIYLDLLILLKTIGAMLSFRGR